MFRSVASQLAKVARGSVGLTAPRLGAVATVRQSHGGPVESDAEFDARYEAFFNRADIDGWQVRKGMNDILGMDLVPEPKIIVAGLKACRRVNDFALAIRWLEGVVDKCGPKKAEIYPYLLSEIRPTLDQLGINTPEELGYDTPELGLKTVWED